ncbi:hypothetical protein LCGC14_2817960 [marine sediment metagenome]|uniref:DUF2442 domain-containing protein n=1 Tax=marine sediment metagenome TaxID=412755 RepID=A0A0F9B970_9ZZZZ
MDNNYYDLNKTVKNIFAGETHVVIEFTDGSSLQIDAFISADRAGAYAAIEIGEIDGPS